VRQDGAIWNSREPANHAITLARVGGTLLATAGGMMAQWRSAALLVLLSAPLACGGEDNSDDGGTGRAGSGGGGRGGSGGASAGGGGTSAGSGGSTAGTGGSGANPSGPPLLERPASVEYDCSVERAMTLLDINPWSSPALLTRGTSTALARIEGGYIEGPALTWSPIGIDGALGAASEIHRPPRTSFMNGMDAVPTTGGAAVAWTETLSDNSGSVTFARLDDAGAVAGSPIQIPSVGDAPSMLQLALSDGSFGMVWTEPLDNLGTNAMKFARVTADGQAGTPRTLGQGNGAMQPLSLVSAPSGYLLTYTAGSWTTGLGTFVLALDAEGAPLRDAWKLGNGIGATSILARGERFLVAYTEEAGSYDTQEIQRSIRLGWLDANGERTGDVHALQAPITHDEFVHPTWIDLGDDVGLAWSQGSIIYICAGCFPDNELRFVVLDGDDLTPKSEVLELASPTAFGLLRPRATVSGSDILLIANVTHHVDAEGASATLRCTR
jgi:hypothetical protein